MVIVCFVLVFHTDSRDIENGPCVACPRVPMKRSLGSQGRGAQSQPTLVPLSTRGLVSKSNIVGV